MDFDPQLLCVSPGRFKQHLEIITRYFHPLTIKSLGQRLREGKGLHKSIAVTFDDGYADNLCHAKPLVERYGVPATFFVTSGFIEQGQNFWWDDLERLLLHPSQLPRELQIMLNGQVYSWNLGEFATWTDDMYQLYLRWNITSPETPTSRHEIYRILHGLLKEQGPRERSHVLQCLAREAIVPREDRSSLGTLTPEEVRQLSKGELVEIGAHTVTHPQLSALPTKDQCWEIRESRRALESLTNRPVLSFSYPFGSKGDFDNVAVDLIRESGFQQACANVPGVVTFKSDLFELPRLIVRNWDGDEFEHRLRTFFGN
jgi:peptidoglycan/xylan/chitin deacetylase (PgdA/CDA1 family)